jgi:hypothetical protein
MIILAEQRREWRAGLSAVAVVLGATIGSWLMLSAPLDPESLGASVVPRAEAASRFAEQPLGPDRLNRAGPIQEAQAGTLPQPDSGGAPSSGPQMQLSAPLTHDDIVKVQERLKALGYAPGRADGRPGKRTIEALNAYRDSLGLQPTTEIDRQAVAPLLP